MALKLATATVNALANQITTLVDSGSGPGTLKIYDGTQPASANFAVSTQVLLGTLIFSKPSFGAASAGVITASAITPDPAAPATGTATWARLADSTGAAIIDVDVDTSGAFCNLNTTSIIAGGPIAITSMSITMPAN